MDNQKKKTEESIFDVIRRVGDKVMDELIKNYSEEGKEKKNDDQI